MDGMDELNDKYKNFEHQKSLVYENISSDQQVHFQNYTNAADDLIKTLLAQISGLRQEVTSIRSIKNEKQEIYEQSLVVVKKTNEGEVPYGLTCQELTIPSINTCTSFATHRKAASEYLDPEPSLSSQGTTYIKVEDRNQPSGKDLAILEMMEAVRSTREDDDAEAYENAARAAAMKKALREKLKEVSSKTDTIINKKPVIEDSPPRLSDTWFDTKSEPEDLDQHSELKEDEDLDRHSGERDPMVVEKHIFF